MEPTLAILEKLSAGGGVPPEVPAAGIMVVMAVLAFFRSAVRQYAGMICLILGGFAGWWVFRQIDSWEWVGEMTAAWQVAWAAVAGFFVYGVIRGIVRFFMDVGLLKLIGSLLGKKKGAGLLGAFLSIIPSAFLVLVLAGIFRFAGSIHDLERTQAALEQLPGTEAPAATPVAKVARAIDGSILGQALDVGDPLQTKKVKSLLELLLLSNDATAWWALNNYPKTGPILKMPAVSDFRSDPSVIEAIINGDHAYLLSREELWSMVKDPEMAKALAEIDIEEVVTKALYNDDEASGTRIRRSPRTDI